MQKVIKIIFFKINKLVNFVIFTPFLLILIFLNFFKKMRIYKIPYFLGSGVDLKILLCKKKMGLHRNFFDIFFISDYFKIFYLKKNISNIFWLKIIARELIFVSSKNKFFFILYNFAMAKIYDLIVFFGINSLLIELEAGSGYFHNNIKNMEIYNQNKSPLIQLSKEDLSQCENEYKNLNRIMSVKPEQSIITLCNRDGAYKRHQLPNMNLDYHNYRNFEVQDYELCVRNMIKKDFYVIRMGNITEKRLEYSDPNFFDYSKSNNISPLMDIYLIYKSKFFIGPESGLDKVADIFRKPVVLINMHRLLDKDIFYSFHNKKKNIEVYNQNKSSASQLLKKDLSKNKGENIFFIPQKLFNLKNNKYLTFAEMLDPELKKNNRDGLSVGQYARSSDYSEAGIEIINNTPEEINDVAEEMHLYLEGKLELSDEDLKLQREFWSKFNNEFLYSETYKISPSFLRNNTELLA